MKVLLIAGGTGSERDISLLSAKNIQDVLKHKGIPVQQFDLQEGYGALEKIVNDFDVVFPVVHGKEGEDGTLYRFLQSKEVPFIGSDPKGASIAFDKVAFKKYCEQHTITTGKWKIVQSSDDVISFGFPCVLKASRGGSSKEVIMLPDEQSIHAFRVAQLLTTENTWYVEELLHGIEVTAGVLVNKALPLIEIIPPKGKWFDYSSKYSGESQEIVGAPSVNESIQREIQQIALQVHNDLQLGLYSRADFIIVEDIPYILETNTPGGVGFTEQSLFPKAAQAVGINFDTLVLNLIVSSKLS